MNFEWDEAKSKANLLNRRNISEPSKTDWERLNRMTDDAIDYSDIPPLEDEFFARARVYISPAKRASYVELDQDIMTWFQQRDGHYPNLINIVLRKYIEIQQEIAG
jgi:uncharacterized protein (DUF4415 family)